MKEREYFRYVQRYIEKNSVSLCLCVEFIYERKKNDSEALLCFAVVAVNH